MDTKIKLAAVSYLNTKPLLYGIEHGMPDRQVELILDYPSRMMPLLQSGSVDIALVPVATLPLIENGHIVSDYGIGADGAVASVCLFSQVPMEEIRVVYLDYQSRTSVALVRLLFKKHWKQEVEFRPAPENYIEYINGYTAGVIIGDRALQQLVNFEYIYDLSSAWKECTGLPFVFAVWIACRRLPEGVSEALNKAFQYGLEHMEEVVAANPFPYYDLHTYYSENIIYRIDEKMHEGMRRFLSELDSLPK